MHGSRIDRRHRLLVPDVIERVREIAAEKRLDPRRRAVLPARRTIDPPRNAESDAGEEDDQYDECRGEPVGHWGTGEGTEARTRLPEVPGTGANIIPLIAAAVMRATEKRTAVDQSRHMLKDNLETTFFSAIRTSISAHSTRHRKG
jgi:hypothetical protein